MNVFMSTCGFSVGPALVKRHFRLILAASEQLMTYVGDGVPGIAVRSRNPLPSSQATSEYSVWAAALLPNQRRSLTAQSVPALRIIRAAIALTSLFSGNWHTRSGDLPLATSAARLPSAARQEMPVGPSGP